MSFSSLILSIVLAFCTLSLSAQEKAPAGGVKQIDPFRKEEKSKSVEKKPNPFQDLLNQKVELPKKKRQAVAPKKKTTEGSDNPFETVDEGNPFGDGPANPFMTDDSDDPFGGNGPANPFDSDDFGEPESINPSNPFAAGDPFADEDPRNQGALPSKAAKPKGPTNQAKPKTKVPDSDEPYTNPFLD